MLLLQLVHQRPSPYHATLPHLTTASVEALGEQYAVVSWLSQPATPGGQEEPTQPTVEQAKADMERLRADGYAFVVLHPNMVPRARRRDAVQVLTKALGSPFAKERQGWIAWSLTGLEAPELVREPERPARGGPPPR